MPNIYHTPEEFVEHIRFLFDYDSEQGILYWKNPPKYGSKPGNIAGSNQSEKRRYSKITFGRTTYSTHRIVWMYVNGVIPDDMEIDHIDCNRYNNRITNLRLASRQENATNRGIMKNNTSGIKGVVWIARIERWRVKIMINQVSHYLGHYKTTEEAKEVADAFRIKHCGNFVNLN